MNVRLTWQFANPVGISLKERPVVDTNCSGGRPPSKGGSRNFGWSQPLAAPAAVNENMFSQSFMVLFATAGMVKLIVTCLMLFAKRSSLFG
jgi:hypothetical protein